MAVCARFMGWKTSRTDRHGDTRRGVVNTVHLSNTRTSPKKSIKTEYVDPSLCHPIPIALLVCWQPSILTYLAGDENQQLVSSKEALTQTHLVIIIIIVVIIIIIIILIIIIITNYSNEVRTIMMMMIMTRCVCVSASFESTSCWFSAPTK